MATKIIKTDDLDGTEGAETHTITLDGESWTIDLSPKNLEKLMKALAPYLMERQREASTSEIREWATSQGLKVPARGRLPKDVVESFYSQ